MKRVGLFAYYISIPAVLAAVTLVYLRLISAVDGESVSLGVAVVGAFVYVLLLIPALSAVMMRFSVLKYVVDPIAAALVPISVFGIAAFEKISEFGFRKGFTYTVINMDTDGFAYLVLLYIFSFIFTISFRRARGDSLPGRIAARVKNLKTKEDEKCPK